MNRSIVVMDGFFPVQALPAILEDLGGRASPGGDAWLGNRPPPKDQGRQRQHRRSLPPCDLQRDLSTCRPTVNRRK